MVQVHFMSERASLHPMTAQDADLLARVAEDPDAAAALVRRHQAAMMRFVSRMLGPNDPEVDDVVQQSFIAAVGSASLHRRRGIHRPRDRRSRRRSHRHGASLANRGPPAPSTAPPGPEGVTMNTDPFNNLDTLLPARGLQPDDVDALVDAVHAGVTATHRRRRFRQRAIPLAIAALLLLAVGLRGWIAASSPSTTTPPSNIVSLEPIDQQDSGIEVDDRVWASEGTRYALHGPISDREVTLEAGHLRCNVATPMPGARFPVVRGGDEGAVSGTRFQVIADGAMLTEGSVAPG